MNNWFLGLRWITIFCVMLVRKRMLRNLPQDAILFSEILQWQEREKSLRQPQRKRAENER